MNEQDKGLLLKDLCARLPYGVMMNVLRSNVIEVAININPFNEEIWLNDAGAYVDIDEIKPYLRPMSSMTNDERFEYLDFLKAEIKDGGYVTENYVVSLADMPMLIDWLNKKMFDYHGLIEKDLALPAPEGMYDFK